MYQFKGSYPSLITDYIKVALLDKLPTEISLPTEYPTIHYKTHLNLCKIDVNILIALNQNKDSSKFITSQY